MEAKLYLIAALFSQHILRIQSVSILCKERAKREQSEGKERARRGKPLSSPEIGLQQSKQNSGL